MADSLLLKFGADTAQLQSGLRGAIKSIAGIAAAFVSARAVAQSFSKALEMGGRLNDLSSRTGVAAGQLALLERAFKNSGASAEKLGPTINKMQKSLQDAAEGTKESVDALDLLGLTFSDLEGMSPDKQFQTIGERIQGLTSPTQRAAAAMGIFGRSGAELLPFFRNFSGEMTTASNQLGSLPGIMDRANQGFDNMGDKLAAIQEKGTEFAAGVIAGFGEIQTSLDTFDAAGIGEKLGKGFGALTANFGKSMEAVWLHSLAQVADLGNSLASNFNSGAEVLTKTFAALGDSTIPTIGKLLMNSLGAAAANFNMLLINAAMDFLTTAAMIPGLADAANAAIQTMIESRAQTIVDQQVFNAGLTSAAGKITDAFKFASETTPKISKDIFGSAEKFEAAAKAAQEAMGMTGAQISDPLQGQFSAMPQWMKDRLGLGAKPEIEGDGTSTPEPSGGGSMSTPEATGGRRKIIGAKSSDTLFGKRGQEGFSADVFSGEESPSMKMARERTEREAKKREDVSKRKAGEEGKATERKEKPVQNTIEQIASRIEKLVEKIEPKLPVAALTA